MAIQSMNTSSLMFVVFLFSIIFFSFPLSSYAQSHNKTHVVPKECEASVSDCNNESAALRLKIIAIASILVTSLIGVCFPLFSRFVPMMMPDRDPFVIVKAFASGIILATGFMHVLPDSFDMLRSVCLPRNPWHKFPFSGFLAMLSAVFALMVDSLVTSFYSSKRKDNYVIPKSESTDIETENIGGNVHVHGHNHHGVPKKGGGDTLLLRYRVVAMNFSIPQASAANHASLIDNFRESLFEAIKNRMTEQIRLDSETNKTGSIWHVFLQRDFSDMLYGYKFDGKFSPNEGQYYDSSRILLDPYAKAVVSRGEYGALGPEGNCWPQMAGMVPSPDDQFDWEGDAPLHNPQKDLIIYETNVRGFTRHESSHATHPRTYLGVVEKLDHLKELGVNCIELMPFQECNELEYYSYNSVLGDYKYTPAFASLSTVNYFSQMIRYSSVGMRNSGRDALNEGKFLIREAHKRGIEVLMDVVFNHTVEGSEQGPILSFRGVINSAYYMLAPKIRGNDWCSPTSLYWIIEMQVDGFRFDLASIMTRSSSLWDAVNVNGNPIDGELLTKGTPLSSPPLVDMISNVPILRDVKLIAEAWDAGELYQAGHFPHWGIWSEWNGKVLNEDDIPPSGVQSPL
ncbi:hypothetical protein H6P81_009294 [Aristolochia fimbriata]|uniref:Glycosyl hydrolase family 13 catalytic domain-containing protein n=1 Tax=Aristolochia fimbriata TaxID=158543 RepID=A0AAV7EL07_ARIFI|nr:hypothetical protein H6P81_009294 [Aristolochia fimbriata]